MILSRLAKTLVLIVLILILAVMVNKHIPLIPLFSTNYEEPGSLNNIIWGFAQRGPIDKGIMARGKVVLDATYPVVPKVRGRIKAVLVNVGDSIKKAQTLAIIEAGPVFLDQVEEAIFNIKRLTIQIGEDKDRIKNEKILLKERVSSEKRLRVLTRNLLLKENELSFWQGKLQRYALQANRPYNPDKTPTAKLYVKAPVSGTVLSINGRPSHYTQPLIDEGIPMFILGDLSQIYLRARISQIDLAAIHKGAPVIMHFDGISDVSYQGHISRTPLKSQPSPQLTIPYFDVSVSFDTFDKRLKIGMTCDLNVIVEHKDQALLVDASAIHFKDSPGVFVRTPEGFAFRPVQLGIEGITKVEVLSGLKQGEAIILNALEVAKNIDQ